MKKNSLLPEENMSSLKKSDKEELKQQLLEWRSLGEQTFFENLERLVGELVESRKTLEKELCYLKDAQVQIKAWYEKCLAKEQERMRLECAAKDAELLEATRCLADDTELILQLKQEMEQLRQSEEKQTSDKHSEDVCSKITAGKGLGVYLEGWREKKRQHLILRILKDRAFSKGQLSILQEAIAKELTFEELKDLSNPQIPFKNMQAMLNFYLERRAANEGREQ